MALRFCDGCDHYVTADLLTKWTVKTNDPVISAGQGRRGSAAIKFDANNAYNLTKTLNAQGTWIVGFSFRPTSVPSNNVRVVAFLDAGSEQCSLRVNGSGTLFASRNGTTLGTSTHTLRPMSPRISR